MSGGGCHCSVAEPGGQRENRLLDLRLDNFAGQRPPLVKPQLQLGNLGGDFGTFPGGGFGKLLQRGRLSAAQPVEVLAWPAQSRVCRAV